MWIQQIRQYGNNDIKRLLVGNKSDLTDQRTVEYEKAKVFNTHKISNELFFVSQELADSLCIPYIETSVKNSINVEQAFKAMITEIIPDKPSLESTDTNIKLDSESKAKKNSSGFCQAHSIHFLLVTLIYFFF